MIRPCQFRPARYAAPLGLGLGLATRQIRAPDKAPPASPEMMMDPEIDNPVLWSNEGPGGMGSIVDGGEITSLNDDGTLPTAGPLKVGVRTTIGQQYRLRVQFLSTLSGLTRFYLLDIDTSDEQLVAQGFDYAQLLDFTFTATVSATHVQIRFYEFSVRIGSISLEPVTP